MESPAPSLYEDWLERRRRTNDVSEMAAPRRVLDYLLNRFHNDPAAHGPARFPAHTELFLDRRALLVHRHISLLPHSEVRNSGDATRKVSRILKRIRTQAPQESVKPPMGGAMVGPVDWDPEPARLGRLDASCKDLNNERRLKLLSEYPFDRALAACELAENGTLDDVNLLLDLLSLTPTPLSEIPAQEPREILEFEECDVSLLLKVLRARESAPQVCFIMNERELLEACAMSLAQRANCIE